MSGGRYEYSFEKLTDMINALVVSKDPLRREFATHLSLVQEAMHDIEWVDSGDCVPGDEHKAIRKVLKTQVPTVSSVRKVRKGYRS